MAAEIEPSPLVEKVLTTLTNMGLVEGMNMALARRADFGSRLEALLTGVALDPLARPVADRLLDDYWAEQNVDNMLDGALTTAEAVVGSGFHAAVYAATRVRKGFPRPYVLERETRVGGTFAMTAAPTFYLNSRNRPGGPGLAGDLGASLNHLPGGIIQATNVGMSEYQTNTDMAFVIRLTLAQFANVLPGVRLLRVDGDGDLVLQTPRRQAEEWFCGRVIIATGCGVPAERPRGERNRVLTFPEFMARMEKPWPLQGLRRVAVVGDGDSGKCAVESLLGLAPQPFMSCAALDHVQLVDWYGPNLPNTCEAWQDTIRGRYQRIGRYLRPDRMGNTRLRVVQREGSPDELPDGVIIDGRSYDLVVTCCGVGRETIEGVGFPDRLDAVEASNEEVIARADEERQLFVVGPAAGIPFGQRERDDGIALVPQNRVAMFRTGTKTALLAAQLGSTD